MWGRLSDLPSMPRLPRIDIPGIPQHIVQRGNDRQPCFFTHLDRIRYLDELRELTMRCGCSVHAYVLMTNHVHLLLTASDRGQVSSLMQSLGRRYVRFVNLRYRRTGTLWEGRYKSCVVDTETYLLRCYRYIELNPVRAGMVEAPGQYRWSSYLANAAAAFDALVSPHPTWLALGQTARERAEAYAALVAEAVPDEELATIRQYVQRQQALGSTRFQSAIERQLGRRCSPGTPGRPRQAEKVL